MQSLFSILKSTHFALALAVATGSVVSSSGATVYGSSGMESGGQLLPYVVGDGGVNPESLELYEVTAGIAVSWLNSDPEGAAAWVLGLPDSARREIANISLGATISDPAILNSALQLAMERWLAASGGAEFGWEIPGGDDRGRERERGGENSDREILLNWLNSDPSLAADPAFGSGSLGLAVPEPSVSLLGALGALGILRRRR